MEKTVLGTQHGKDVELDTDRHYSILESSASTQEPHEVLTAALPENKD